MKNEKIEKGQTSECENKQQGHSQSKESTNDPKVILIAEDVEINFMLLNTYLKRSYTVVRAHDGLEAVELFKEMHPDMILMDCKMPNMDGLDATRVIHELSPKTPVIMQSAYTFETDRQNAFDAGCIDFIAKPIIRDELFEKIQKYLPI